MTINYSYDLVDGVYAFKSKSFSNRWLTVGIDEGEILPEVGDYMTHKYSTETPSDTAIFDCTSLFKITKVAEKTNTPPRKIRYTLYG